MHSEPIPDIARDPILDGRDSLRLVKLRLALTLLTVALLPIAAVAPVARAISGEASLGHHSQLDAEAAAAAARFAGELAAVAGLAASLLDDPDVVGAALDDPRRAAAATASARLEQLVGRPSGAVAGVALVVGSEVRAAAGRAPDLRLLPADRGSGIDVPPRGDPGSLVLVETADASRNRPARSLVVSLALEPLLAWAAPASSLPGRTLYLVDETGASVATARAAFDASVLPGQVLDLATDAARTSEGRGQVAAAGLEAWLVLVRAPLPLTALPTSAVAALVALLVLLVALATWMARLVLRPAARLEASRSRLRELYESARDAAFKDSLTGLGNHRSFQEAVARQVDASRRYGMPFALVLFDVDEFKRTNDSRGHAVGDQLLAELGRLIRTTTRLADEGFRVGGDEFAILMPHTSAEAAAVATTRLLSRALDDRGGDGYPGPISFSAGVTACPEFGATRMQLTAQADAALYRGKRAGRTVVTVYDPALDHGHVDEGMRLELSSAITSIIEDGLLRPVYQPIVDLATGAITGYEGLVRVPPGSSFPHTGALFDAAEISGRVLELDRAALEVVVAGARDLEPALALSLNVSPLTLESPEFSPTFLLAILRRHGISPERVIVELTERQAARNAASLGSVIRELRRAGIRVAADDVGAGNAGLRLLSQHRFDVVKIDLSLVQAGGRDQGLSVLTSLVQMADRLGAMTIAEGVETPEQLRMIRQLGVTAGQGYLLGRPGPEHPAGSVDVAALAAREPEAPEPEDDGSLLPPLDQPDGGSSSRASRSMAVLNTASVSNE